VSPLRFTAAAFVAALLAAPAALAQSGAGAEPPPFDMGTGFAPATGVPANGAATQPSFGAAPAGTPGAAAVDATMAPAGAVGTASQIVPSTAEHGPQGDASPPPAAPTLAPAPFTAAPFTAASPLPAPAAAAAPTPIEPLAPPFAPPPAAAPAAPAASPFVASPTPAAPAPSTAPAAATAGRPAAPAAARPGGDRTAPSAAPAKPVSSGVPFSAAPITATPAQPGTPSYGQVPPFQMGLDPSVTIVPNVVPESDAAPAMRPPAAGARAALGSVDRPILPEPDLRLAGESDYRELTVYLSPAEVARRAKFSIGFVNSVLVMPEASRLRVSINGRPVIEVPIEASNDPRQVDAALPPDLLRTGANTVRISAVQRHRVDCSLRATYELWTLLVPGLTGFSFDGGRVPVDGLADLPSIGVDGRGATRIRVVPIGAPNPTRASRIVTAAQAIAVMGRFAHPVVELIDASAPPDGGPGVLQVVVGTTAGIRAVPGLGGIAELAGGEASARPVATMAPDPRSGVPTLVVSGPTLEDVDRALARFVVQADRSTREPPGRTQRWRAPDVPLFAGGEAMTLGALGVRTEEFSGRRFQTHFTMALPPDFYAAAYGEANLWLDAAFSPEVKPGSAIDIYVNSALAVTVNLTSEQGGLFRQRQVKIPLRSFRPGPNRISLEANLFTDADVRCLPGATMPGRARFVLFDTSVFRMSNYARFGELPNLAAFAAGGFPYDTSGGAALPVFVAGEGSSASAAAATLISRLSVSAGRPLPVRVVPSASDVEGGSALLVGAMGDLGPEVLDVIGIGDALSGAWGSNRAAPAAEAPSSQPRQEIDRYEQVLTRLRALKADDGGGAPAMPWREPAAAPTAVPDAERDDLGLRDTREIYDRWQSDLSGGGLDALAVRFTGWLNSSFGLTLDMLHLAPSPTGDVRLAPRTDFVLAQVRAPAAGQETWTVATAPSSAALLAGVEGITAPQTWRTLSGSVAGYQESSGIVQDFTPASLYYEQTVPFSFENVRLIAANWFSLNVLEYALALMLSSASLGLVTWVLIRQIGREGQG